MKSTMSPPLALAHEMAIWTLSHLTFFCFVLFLIRIVARRWRSPLRQVPGPWLAGYTRLWKLYHTCRGNMEQVNIDLHRIYGEYYFTTPCRLPNDEANGKQVLLFASLHLKLASTTQRIASGSSTAMERISQRFALHFDLFIFVVHI